MLCSGGGDVGLQCKTGKSLLCRQSSPRCHFYFELIVMLLIPSILPLSSHVVDELRVPVFLFNTHDTSFFLLLMKICKFSGGKEVVQILPGYRVQTVCDIIYTVKVLRISNNTVYSHLV